MYTTYIFEITKYDLKWYTVKSFLKLLIVQINTIIFIFIIHKHLKTNYDNSQYMLLYMCFMR